MHITYNIPFFSLFLVLLSAIASPLIRRRDGALRLAQGVELTVALLSA